MAFMLTMIRWWEAVRAPDVAKWQQKYLVELKMPRVGAMEELSDQRGSKKPSSGSWLPVVCAWATHLNFPRKILRVPCGVLRAPAEFSV